jgi:ABC-2 type transport system permease protein
VYASLEPGASIGGYDATEIITYISVAWIGRSLTFNNIDREISSQVTEGNITQSLLKPIDFQVMTYFGALGEAGFRLVLFTLPISVVVFPLFRVGAPVSAGAAAAVAVSYFLAFLVGSGINFVLGTFALRLKSILGLVRAKMLMLAFLTGTLVPLTFFPGPLRTAVELLPFQAMSYIPVTIWLGKRTGPELWEGLAIQLFWAVALFALGRVLWLTGVRRASVQGG